MKNAIVQYHVDLSHYVDNFKTDIKETTDFVEQYSKLSFERYAEKYDCDFIRITEPKVGYKHPTWERIDVWLDPEWFVKYDQVCYTDTDVFAMPWAPNIFEFTDINSFNKARYHKARNRDPNDKNLWWLHDIPFEQYQKEGFQCGVYVVTKKSRDESIEWFERYEIDQHKFEHDGHFVPYSIMRSDASIHDIPEAFNTKWWPTTGFKNDVYFYHAWGRSKTNYPDLFKQQLFDLFGEL